MEYNTTRNHLVIREYGRNIQKMIEYLITIEDKEERQKNALTVIELMGTLNPHLKNVEDFRHKLWDHLFLISDFKLDVDSPYPTPTAASLEPKPEPLPYPNRYPKYRHFGKNLEYIVEKARNEQDEEIKEGLIQSIGNYMKLSYANWHHEIIHDDMIKAELGKITNDELVYENNHQYQNISVDTAYRSKRKNYPYKNNKSNGKSNNYKYNKYKNRSK